MFAGNRFMRLPRLPFILHRYIYNYIKDKSESATDNYEVKKVRNFYLQNLIFFSLLRAKHHIKIELSTQERNNDAKNLKFRRKFAKKALILKDNQFKSIKDEDDLAELQDFNQYCIDKNVALYKFWDRVTDVRTRE